jgi:hypothetical protein
MCFCLEKWDAIPIHHVVDIKNPSLIYFNESDAIGDCLDVRIIDNEERFCDLN